MDERKLYTGLGMLLVPLLIYLGVLLLQSSIDWGNVMEGIFTMVIIAIGILYVGVAFGLIIKGAIEE